MLVSQVTEQMAVTRADKALYITSLLVRII